MITSSMIETIVKPALKEYYYGNAMKAQKAYDFLAGFCDVNNASLVKTIEDGRKLFPVISPLTRHKR